MMLGAVEKWYKTDRWGYNVAEISVIRVQEKSITILDSMGRQITEPRTTDWHIYHRTIKEAVDYLFGRLELDKERIRHHEEEYRATLKKFNAKSPRRSK